MKLFTRNTTSDKLEKFCDKRENEIEVAFSKANSLVQDYKVKVQAGIKESEESIIAIENLADVKIKEITISRDTSIDNLKILGNRLKERFKNISK